MIHFLHIYCHRPRFFRKAVIHFYTAQACIVGKPYAPLVLEWVKTPLQTARMVIVIAGREQWAKYLLSDGWKAIFQLVYMTGGIEMVFFCVLSKQARDKILNSKLWYKINVSKDSKRNGNEVKTGGQWLAILSLYWCSGSTHSSFFVPPTSIFQIRDSYSFFCLSIKIIANSILISLQGNLNIGS